MLLKFNLSDKTLELSNVFFVGEGFIIGEHPLTKETCLFLSDLNLLKSRTVSVALQRLGLEEAPGRGGELHNIKFKQLRSKNGKQRAKVSLRGRARQACPGRIRRDVDCLGSEENAKQGTERL